MSPRVTLQVLEALDVTSLPREGQAAALVQGTGSVLALIEQVVQPVIGAQLAPSLSEQALLLTFGRMALVLKSVAALKEPFHFQIVNTAARTIFELILDLKLIQSDHGLADKYFAFPRVSKFYKAAQLLRFLRSNASLDCSVHQAAVEFADDPQRKQEVEADCRRLWGTKRNGDPVVPEHWSGATVPERARRCGLELEEIYRSQFFLQSYYVHAGPAGVDGLSPDALICSFAIAHRLIQQLACLATETVGVEFHLFDTDLELREKLLRASVASGFFAVQAALDQQVRVTNVSMGP